MNEYLQEPTASYYLVILIAVLLTIIGFYFLVRLINKQLNRDIIDNTKEEAIHDMFGLTYANYLVLPRTLLQSMPGEWQVKFVALLDEYQDVMDPWIDYTTEYQVTARDYKTGKYRKDPLSNYQRGRRHVIRDNEPILNKLPEYVEEEN